MKISWDFAQHFRWACQRGADFSEIVTQSCWSTNTGPARELRFGGACMLRGQSELKDIFGKHQGHALPLHSAQADSERKTKRNTNFAGMRKPIFYLPETVQKIRARRWRRRRIGEETIFLGEKKKNSSSARCYLTASLCGTALQSWLYSAIAQIYCKSLSNISD